MHTAEKQGFLLSDKDEFKQMMIINSLRGIHSTGLAGVDSRRGGDINIVKTVGSPYNLFMFDKTDDFMNRMVRDFDNIIGHGRYATRGKIDAPNAHPYEEGHITLAHNGVINNFHMLKDWKKHKDIEVDSHLIAKLFEEEGAIDVLPTIEGAYVFIWYDSETEKLNIARNAQRPLFVAHQQNRETLVFASEAETLRWNAERNNTPIKSLVEIPTHCILSYSQGSVEPEVETYEPKAPKYSQTSYSRTHTPTTETTRGGTEWKRPPKKSFEASQEDLNLLENIKDAVKLELGTLQSFSVDDYRMEHNYIMLWGYSEALPRVKFRATIKDVIENDLFHADEAVGKVISILPTPVSDKDFDWAVMLGEVSLIQANVDETRVYILSVGGVQNTISKHRLKGLQEHDCAWCKGRIHDSEIQQPETLLLQDGVGGADQLVCPDCAQHLIDMYLADTPSIH